MKKETASKNKDSEEKLFDWKSLILLAIFLAIGLSFFISLSVVKSNQLDGGVKLSPNSKEDFSFGWDEAIFSTVFAFFMVGFLTWTKSIIKKNAYFGVGIGVVGCVILGYAFYLNYRGFYSTGFMILTGLIVLVYLGMNFYKYRKENYEEDED